MTNIKDWSNEQFKIPDQSHILNNTAFSVNCIFCELFFQTWSYHYAVNKEILPIMFMIPTTWVSNVALFVTNFTELYLEHWNCNHSNSDLINLGQPPTDRSPQYHISKIWTTEYRDQRREQISDCIYPL